MNLVTQPTGNTFVAAIEHSGSYFYAGLSKVSLTAGQGRRKCTLGLSRWHQCCLGSSDSNDSILALLKLVQSQAEFAATVVVCTSSLVTSSSPSRAELFVAVSNGQSISESSVLHVVHTRQRVQGSCCLHNLLWDARAEGVQTFIAVHDQEDISVRAGA